MEYIGRVQGLEQGSEIVLLPPVYQHHDPGIVIIFQNSEFRYVYHQVSQPILAFV